jgi:hypothetical protein
MTRRSMAGLVQQREELELELEKQGDWEASGQWL